MKSRKLEDLLPREEPDSGLGLQSRGWVRVSSLLRQPRCLCGGLGGRFVGVTALSLPRAQVPALEPVPPSYLCVERNVGS